MNATTHVFQAASRLIAYAATLISYANAADAAVQRRRRRKLAAAAAAVLLLPGCARPAPAPVHPEPPQIHRLDCGGSACTITTSGSATIVWVQE